MFSQIKITILKFDIFVYVFCCTFVVKIMSIGRILYAIES